MRDENVPDHYYAAYIDEAGDPGLRSVRPIDEVGGTEWLCLGAVVIRASQSSKAVGWVRSMLEEAGVRNPSDLHYRNFARFPQDIHMFCDRAASNKSLCPRF